MSPSPAEVLMVSPPRAFVAPTAPVNVTSPLPEVIANKSLKEVASFASIAPAKLTFPAPADPVSIVVVPLLLKLTPEVLNLIFLLAVMNFAEVPLMTILFPVLTAV